MRKFQTLAFLMMVAVAVTACSDDEPDAAQMEADRVKLLAEFQPLQKQYMELYDKERAASSKIIPFKNQLRGAKKSGNENLAAEMQTKLEGAEQTWRSLKDELEALGKKRDKMMADLRKLGHKFRGD